MAIGTACDLFREAEAVVLAVVALHVGLDGDVEDVVALHHLFIAMAFQADLGVEVTVGIAFGVTQGFYLVQAMAVVAGGRVLVAGRHRLAVDRLLVDRLLVVALDAFGNDDALVVFPVFVDMNIGMAVGAHDTLGNVDAGVVFGVLLFVAALALDLLDLDLLFHVLDEIGDVHMATGTGIFAMDRLGKRPHGDLVAVAAQAGGRVDRHSLFGQRRTGPGYQQHQKRQKTTENKLHDSAPPYH